MRIRFVRNFWEKQGRKSDVQAKRARRTGMAYASTFAQAPQNQTSDPVAAAEAAGSGVEPRRTLVVVGRDL